MCITSCLNCICFHWVIFNHFPRVAYKEFSIVRASSLDPCSHCRMPVWYRYCIWEMFWDFLCSSGIKELPHTSVKGFASVLASFQILDPALLPASRVLLLGIVIFPPVGINVHLIVKLLLPLRIISVNTSNPFICSPLLQECELFPLIKVVILNPVQFLF